MWTGNGLYLLQLTHKVQNCSKAGQSWSKQTHLAKHRSALRGHWRVHSRGGPHMLMACFEPPRPSRLCMAPAPDALTSTMCWSGVEVASVCIPWTHPRTAAHQLGPLVSALRRLPKGSLDGLVIVPETCPPPLLTDRPPTPTPLA